MFIRKFLSQKKREYLHHLRSKYFEDIRVLVGDNPSIISNNCLAGRIYQDLKIPYSSPTAGLYIFFPDYIDFLENFKENISKPLTFVPNSKYEIGNERHAKTRHPIGLLDNKIEINFLHYRSEAEAEDKWYRRCERINHDNLFIIGGELDLCKPSDIISFDSLPFKRKIFFTANNYHTESSIFIEEFKNKNVVGDPYRYGHVFYRHLIDKFKRRV